MGTRKHDELTQRLRHCRAESGLTQANAAIRVGVHPVTLARWECGATPDLSSALKLADLFGVSLDWLVTGRGPKRRR